MFNRTGAGLMTALMAATLGTTGLAAQEQIGCFRGKPLPECKSFWIVEMQGLTPLLQNSRTLTYWGERGGGVVDTLYSDTGTFGARLEWNMGHMLNVGGGYAVGGIFTLGVGENVSLTGIRLRGRKWLSRDVSLELEGGRVLSDANGSRGGEVRGWTGDLRLNIRDQGSFFVRYDGLTLPEQSLSFDDSSGQFDPGGAQHALLVGVSAGSWPAVAGSGLLGLIMAVFIAGLEN